METVVVLGASANPDRYSFKAIERLRASNHEVIPIHPALEQIQGIPVTSSLKKVSGEVDSVTVYINPQRLAGLVDDLVALGPRRVVMNPGAESAEARSQLEAAGIEVVEGCTLVMLATGQW